MIVKPRSPEDMDTYRDLMAEEAKERKLEAMAEEPKKNYIDKAGNYHNVESLSLAEIYLAGHQDGYKKGYIDAMLERKQPEDVSKIADSALAKIMRGGI